MTQHYTAHIISHTHWDREWYLNSTYTNEWLIPFFDGLFAMLDKEPDYKFVLDGQLSMIDDYFEELSKKGISVTAAKRTIKQHVERKALSIGPYYLQPDWQLTSDESLVRNILIGTTMASALGGSMRSGWLLDNFGQISQTAQIHEQCGITGLYVWRGVAMDPERVTSEFLWESPDGTSLFSVYLLNSYRNVMRLAEYSDMMKDRMVTEVEKLKPFTTSSHLLLMNGYDQEMIPDDIQPYIQSGELDGSDFSTIQDDPDSYIKAIQQEEPDLQVVKGPLYNGRFISVFPGVMSTRMYLKTQNDRLERLLEKKVEPLSVLAWMLGDDYESSHIMLAWKRLLQNHPHDSICGVSIDDVHKDMEMRNRQVYALETSLLDKKVAFLAGAVDSSSSPTKDATIVFNTAPYTRSDVIEQNGASRFVRNIPAMGYKVITEEEYPEQRLVVDGLTAENQFIRFSLQSNGSFNLLYKETGRLYKDLGIIEDMGDSGDEYNYSFPKYDVRITTKDTAAQIEMIDSSDISVTYRVQWILDIPVSDIDDHMRRSRQTQLLPIITYITVKADSPVVSCKTIVRNTAKDHRMRILIPTGIETESSWAGSPFDITERPISIPDYQESEIPEYVRKVIVGAREASPSTYFHTREFVDMNDGKQGIALLHKGLPEYQIIDSDTIALTLFRSVGWIAKDINTRIGDAGPEIYTPDAQCLREMTFEYGVCPHTKDSYSGISRRAELFNNELLVVSTPAKEGPLPSEHSWLHISDTRNCVKITAVKRSEDNSSIILRGVNLSDVQTEVTLTADLQIKRVQQVTLMEKHQSDLSWDTDRTCFSLGPKKIFSIKLSIDTLKTPSFHLPDVLIQDENIQEDFSSYPYSDYVTEKDIEQEITRADKMRRQIDNPLYRRTALEAQLSAILTRHRKDEEIMRKLGYQLNEARVQRRIYDYISTADAKEETI